MSTFNERGLEVLREVAILGKRAALVLNDLENSTLPSNPSVDDINIEEIRKMIDQKEDKIIEDFLHDNIKECNNSIRKAAKNGQHTYGYAFTWLKNKNGLLGSLNKELTEIIQKSAFKNKLTEKLVEYYQQRGFEVNLTNDEIKIMW